jgi:glycosyltransferase involved in cell wall biosynthesis
MSNALPVQSTGDVPVGAADPARLPLSADPPTMSTGVLRPVDLDDRATGPKKRLLFISYAFPPTGGGGVQRSAKFTKYLPEYGWQSTVLTAANPSVPVQDQDLQDDLNRSTKILRARTLEPSYAMKKSLVDSGQRRSGPSIRSLLRRVAMQVLQPDPQVLWNPAAMRMARQTLLQTPHDAIYATGPPFSSFLLGRALKRRFGLPLILDFRDEWLLVSQYLESYQIGPLAYHRQRRMMTRVLKAADAVVATTRASATEIENHCRDHGISPPVTCIYNGYDEDDVANIGPPSTDSQRFRIVYTGTLWKLTDVSPLVSALEHLSSIAPSAARQIECVLAGRRTSEQDVHLQRLRATPVNVEQHDYLPHRSALSLAASAQALVMLLADQPGAERVVPAKLFEYLALQKPILAICPHGETANLLRQHGHLNVFMPSETEKIASWLKNQIAVRAGGPMSSLDSGERSTDLQRFSRRSLTGELAAVLAQVASSA